MTARRGLVLDASVWINLLGTGAAETILAAIGIPRVVVDVTSNEVRRHPLDSTVVDPLEPLVQAGLLLRQALDAEGLATFIALVSADPPNDLGDGEAATISFANQSGFAAVLDEGKARRIAANRFQHLELLSTVQILQLDEVARTLGTNLPNAVFSALSTARMRVLQADVAWVVECIGMERARACTSIRRWLRRAPL